VLGWLLTHGLYAVAIAVKFVPGITQIRVFGVLGFLWILLHYGLLIRSFRHIQFFGLLGFLRILLHYGLLIRSFRLIQFFGLLSFLRILLHYGLHIPSLIQIQVFRLLGFLRILLHYGLLILSFNTLWKSTSLDVSHCVIQPLNCFIGHCSQICLLILNVCLEASHVIFQIVDPLLHRSL
jgi:hypothetical protein